MKKLSDKDIRFFVFFLCFFVSLFFTRFGAVDYDVVGSGSMTTTSYSSMFFVDVIMFLCGWISIGLFMWHFAK